MKIPAKFKKLVLGTNDLLIVTIGSLEKDIYPDEKDLVAYRKFLDKYLGPKAKSRCIIVPPVVKFQVLKNMLQGETK